MELFIENGGMLGANCYMLSSDSAAVLIDVGEFTDNVRRFLTDNKEKEIMLLATHRHFDHVAGICEAKAFSGAKIAVHSLDECGLKSAADSLGANFDVIHSPVEADLLLSDGDCLQVGDISIKVIHTPGHTEGSVCFLIDDMLFSGDTLFHLSVGRTDFPSGNTATLLRSLDKLFSLERDCPVYPGHDRQTKLYYEKQYNPYYNRG